MSSAGHGANYANWHYVQSKVEVLPKLIPLDALLQLSIRRRNHSDINLDRSGSTHTFKLPLLGLSSCLHCLCDLANLIKQNGSTVSEPKRPHAYSVLW